MLKDWKKTKGNEYGFAWKNIKNFMTGNVNIDLRMKNEELIWIVELPSNFKTKSGLNVWRKEFVSKLSAIEFARKYMRTH